MDSKKKYGKAVYIFIGLIAWLIIFKFCKKDILFDLAPQQSLFEEPRTSKIAKKTENLDYVLQCLENEKIYDAFNKINDLPDELPENVKNYLDEFSNYYADNIKSKKSGTQNISYLINNMNVIKNYYEKQGFSEPEAIQRSEIIPFCCIKNFELKKNKANKLYEICDTYLNHTATNHISKRSVAIICLKIRSYYRAEGIAKTNDYIENVQQMITSYQQQFPAELGKNPVYKEEAAYLERFKKLCDSIRNKHVFDKWDRFWFNDKIAALGE